MFKLIYNIIITTTIFKTFSIFGKERLNHIKTIKPHLTSEPDLVIKPPVIASWTGKILSFWSAYRKTAGNEALPLVLAGGIYDSPGDFEGIICTGYVDDSEKRSILQHASLFINPSYYESLSLVVLEALNDRVPVLVNGRCAVLREHCIRSGGGLEYYMDRKDFIRKVSYLTSSEANRSVMADKGKEYYEANYSWETVVRKFADVIEEI